MTLPVQTYEFYNNSTGLNLRDSPTKVPETDASISLNIDYSADGAFTTRNGSTIVNAGAQMDQLNGLGMFDYRKSDGTQVNVIQNGSKIYTNMSTPVSAVTGLNSSAIPDMEPIVTSDDEYLVWGNGVNTNLKFDGTTWTNLSLPLAAAPSGVDNGAGTLGAGDYYYYVSFARTVGGIIVQEGELSPISSVVTIAASRQIRVTIPVCSETLATGVTAQCNARVLYRVSPTSSSVAYRHAIIADNVAVTYDDNTLADGTIEAEFDNQAAPASDIFEENFGCMYYVDANRRTDLYESKPNKPWAVDEENFEILDGPIQCVKRIYGVTFIGTDRSIWVKTARNAEAASQRISSVIGILNNRCADGLSYLYFMGTNFKLYKIAPTDFGFEQVRLDSPISDKVQSLFGDISPALLDKICTKYYTTGIVSKYMTSAPLVSSVNDSLIVYNETQSIATKDNVWQLWNNNQPVTLQMFTINGKANLYAQDNNGFIWKLDDASTAGDGAEINGTITSATATTLTDSTQAWTVNEHVGKTVRILSGTSDGEDGVITSNTATELTVPTWDDTPLAGDTYTIGGYDAYHFSNWKSVTKSYDTLKQMWFFLSNMNASGDYPIDLIIQFDFDETISNSIVLNINLQATNAIWGDFIWGDAIWGSYSVFQDRIRQYGRFRAVRFGFRNRKAGQPFQCNGYSVSCQDKKLFYRGAV